MVGWLVGLLVGLVRRETERQKNRPNPTQERQAWSIPTRPTKQWEGLEWQGVERLEG